VRVAKALLFLFALSFGFSFSTLTMGQEYLAGTPVEQFAPPPSALNYTVNTGNPLGMIGDFFWGTAQVILWVGKFPQYLVAILVAVGVPEPWTTAILVLGTISLAAFIIYMVSGRSFTPRFP